MSIQKITKSELLKNGVKGLPTRPSTPSLYKGSTLSAEELKAAFDKLPTLIAERFNELLESTGLYDAEHPADSLAALIATNLQSSHSLLDFFEDVKNGNLSLYLTADEDGKSLADVLSELRAAIKQAEHFAVSIEGEGDLLTDAEIQSNTLKIVRGARVDEILNEAKTYVDTPSGEVDAGCTTPVSGSRIYHAIEEATDAQAKRIANLENAAKDILYTYPIVEESFLHKRIDKGFLENAALLRAGALPVECYNRFPEKLLYDFTNGDLSIHWDDEEKVLVLNGTLTATDSPLVIAPFDAYIPETKVFACGVFYRGGSVSTNNAMLSLISDTNHTVDLPLLMEDIVHDAEEFYRGDRFQALGIAAEEDTVFDNYRINFIVSFEQIDLHYEPFHSQNRFIVPKKFVCLGPNVWNDEPERVGETYVSFLPDFFSYTGCYMFGFSPQSTLPETKVLVSVLAGEKIVYEKQWKQNEFETGAFYSKDPITEIRVYAAKTRGESVGHSVRIKDIYAYPVDPDYTKSQTYTPYHRDEIVFPDSLKRFADRFIGFDGENCNYFDFEFGYFFDSYRSLQINSSLTFEAVDPSIGRFSATIAVPEELQSQTAVYQPSAIFIKAGATPGYENIWFTSDRVYVQSSVFVGKAASAVNRFFELYPIDIVYKATPQKVFLSEEEGDLCEAPTFTVLPSAYIFFCDDSGALIDAFSKIQYQVKETTA